MLVESSYKSHIELFCKNVGPVKLSSYQAFFFLAKMLSLQDISPYIKVFIYQNVSRNKTSYLVEKVVSFDSFLTWNETITKIRTMNKH